MIFKAIISAAAVNAESELPAAKAAVRQVTDTHSKASLRSRTTM